MENYKDKFKFLNENVAEIMQWIQDNDLAIITAERGYIRYVTSGTDPHDVEMLEKWGEDFYDEDTGKSIRRYPISSEENQERNKKLKAALLSKGYKITADKIVGLFPESGRPKEEASLFVWNWRNDNDFYDTLFSLSEWFNQDCFVYKYVGTKAFTFRGTNNYWPGYKQSAYVGQNVAINIINKFMSLINDKESFVITRLPMEINVDFSTKNDAEIQNILTNIAQEKNNLVDRATIINKGNNNFNGKFYQYDAVKKNWRYLKDLDIDTLDSDIEKVMTENKIILIETIIPRLFGYIGEKHGNAQQIIRTKGSILLEKIRQLNVLNENKRKFTFLNNYKPEEGGQFE